MACLMTVAWATVAARVARLDRVWPSRRNSNKLDLGAALPLAGGLVTSIIIGSLLFGYNAVVTSIFAEPDFRYREMMDLPAIVIAGLGLIAIPDRAEWPRAATARQGLASDEITQFARSTRAMFGSGLRRLSLRSSSSVSQLSLLRRGRYSCSRNISLTAAESWRAWRACASTVPPSWHPAWPVEPEPCLSPLLAANSFNPFII